MTRLFITLYLLLVAALFEYWVITEMLPRFVLNPMKLEYSHQNYQGTRHLLEGRIRGLSTVERDAVIEQIQQQFEYPVHFVEEQSLMLDQDATTLLDEGKLAEREVDGADQGIYRSSVEGMAWVFETDQTQSEHNRRIAIGTFRLVEDALLAAGAEQQGDVLARLNAEFGFPVVLETLSGVSLTPEEKGRIAAGEVIGVNINSDDERYYYASEKLSAEEGNNLRVLRFGPIDFPLSTPLLVGSLLAILAVLIAIAVWIWIKPIWSGMTSLVAATRRFGDGDFSARVKFSKRSGIRDIASAFNQMAERIQNLLGSHRELTNAVSHELRTPLSRMRFSMEMMQNAEAESDRHRHIKNMSSDIDELDNLVSELLTYARFDRDPAKIRTEKIHLPSWLEFEVNRLQPYVDDHPGLTFEVRDASEAMIVMAEPRLLGRVISNLVHNAMRYAKSSVAVCLTPQQGGVRITVEDDGPGIPKKDRQRIFDPFTRLDQSRNRLSGGAGLGLSIVKQIVEWHQGEIEVEDGVTGGARFCIVIPAAETKPLIKAT